MITLPNSLIAVPVDKTAFDFHLSHSILIEKDELVLCYSVPPVTDGDTGNRTLWLINSNVDKPLIFKDGDQILGTVTKRHNRF